MGRAGFEQSSLKPSKTPIQNTRGAKCGALKEDVTQTDPDLALLVDTWQTLPGHTKKSILEIINNFKKGKSHE